MMGNASEFDNGRQLAARPGVVPGQSARAARRAWRQSKAGDPYIRSLLVLGTGAVLNAAANNSLSRWALGLRERRGYWQAVVAIAAKNARTAGAVLTGGESFVLRT